MGAKTLPLGFYDSKGWRKSIIEHYVDNDFSSDTLDFPIEALTIGVENIINVYGDYPLDVVKLIKQSVNPLFAPEEYQTQIYKVIKGEALKTRDPYIDRVAESLYYMRLIFEKDRNYIRDHFKSELEHIQGATEEEKLEKLAEELSMIVKIHAKQVASMITEHCGAA